MGTVTNLNGFFKPELSQFKSEACANTKKVKRKHKPRRSTKWSRMRNNITNHLNINPYASNQSICFAICKKTGLDMPGTRKAYKAMIVEFGKSLNANLKRTPKKEVPTDAFFAKQSWKELRFIALRLSEGRCNLCGGRPSDGLTLHVDHIKPRSQYPELQYDLDNLQVLCEDCNFGKSNYDDTDFRDW